VSELLEWCDGGVKGEITLVVEGHKGSAVTLEDALERVASLVAEGKKTTDAAKQIALETGLSKRELYEAWSRREA
jgi:16S rRNA (cytidine1402-2'-O)-methyltransferase